MLFFVATIAAAAPTGHYHPEDIMVRSKVFAEASDRLSRVFDERSRSLRRLAQALVTYQEALDLLGDRASRAERTRLTELRREYARQEAQVQLVADGVVEDFDSAMVAAMERATRPFGETQRCKARIVEGPRLPGVPVRDRPNPDCKGRDLNDAIAEAMDADETLASTVDEVMDRSWPTVTIDEAPQPPVPAGGGEAIDEWILVHDLLVAAAGESLKAITDRDDEAREAIDAALETEGDVDVEALRTQVNQIEQKTGSARAALAAPILDAAEARLAKKAKGVTIGWCANPRLLGGCQGTDATKDRVALLMSDRKFGKSLP